MSNVVEKWLSERKARSERSLWKKFWSWLQKNYGFNLPEDLLKDFEGLNGKDQYKHIDIIKEFIRSMKDNYTVNSRKAMFATIKSFYSFNRLALPPLSKHDRSYMFEPSESDLKRATESKPVKVEDLKRTLIYADEPYRSIFLVMFQGGIGLSEFHYFNYHGWKELLERDDKGLTLLDKPEPVQIKFVRKKTSTDEVRKFYTFIGKDAKDAIKHWLKVRERRYGSLKRGEPLFIVKRKTLEQKTVSPSDSAIQANLIKSMLKAEVISHTKQKRYDLHPHELRDIFKSLCTLNGVSEVASEYFLGHNIDKLGYNKAPEYDVEFFRKEYEKVEPALNLISGTGKAESNIMIEEFEKRIEEYKGMIEELQLKMEKLEKKEQTEGIGKTETNGGTKITQKVIQEFELESCLSDGWEFQNQLNNGKIVIKKI